MKVLITGANGQLGQDTAKIFRQRGHLVTGAGSQDLDISDFHSVLQVTGKLKPEIIINCAAYNAVDQAESDWKHAYQVNGLGPKNLALASKRIGAKFVHFSTDYIFNGKKGDPYTIADSPDPVSKYGMSKLLGEQMVERHSDNYLLIRVSWVFGSGNTNFVKKILEWSEHKKELSVVDDQISSPTYTVDLAQATCSLIEKDQPGLYHLTNAGFCSRYEWAMYILNAIGWKGHLSSAKSSDFKTAAERPAFSALNNFGSEEVLGYSLPDWKDATIRFLQGIGRL